MIKKTFIFLTLICVSMMSYAWDSTGHRLIAQIAYDNLSPSAKNKVDQLTLIHDEKYPPRSRFLFASTWADQIRNRGNKTYNQWHFIDIPYTEKGMTAPPAATPNVVWAINQSIAILQSNDVTPEKKAKYLRFLIHFVGDAHQPLHCAERFDQEFPSGDNSGVLFVIKDPYVTNLHAFWDEGAGWFRRYGRDYPLTNREVGGLAQRIEQDYPENYFDGRATNLDPQIWAQESFVLAKKAGYSNLATQTQPDSTYVVQAQTVVEQQIALAGYRLAHLLNKLFSD